MNRHLRRAAAALFVVCAALFVIGVSAEGDSHNEASEAAEQSAATEAAGHDESAEAEVGAAAGESGGNAEAAAGEAAEDAESDDAAVGGEAGDDESGEEQVFGIDTESPAAVIAAVLVSLTLAVGLWLRDRRRLALVSVGFAVVFAGFDVAEISHQRDESRTGLAVLAGVIAAGHLAAAATAGLSTRPTETR